MAPIVRQATYMMVSRIVGELRYRGSAYARTFFNIPIEYPFRDFSIWLPADHTLPHYRRNHPKYDRFLPHLAKYMQRPDTVIDVGANVGDTLAGMVEQNAMLSYICIEPDDLFFEHLKKNVERIKISKVDLEVLTIKSLVGKNVSSVSLEGEDGTKHAVISNKGRMKSKSLDDLLAQAADSYSNIRILKSDVDGFDYDVLDSSVAIISEKKPMIFFECQCDYDYQRSGYERTLHSLESEGYCDWTVFDNFGEVVVRTRSLEIVIQLIQYVWHQNIGQATRTIYYFDVLAVQMKDAELINHVLADYGQLGLTECSTNR